MVAAMGDEKPTDAADDLIVKLMNMNSGMHAIIVECVMTNSCTEKARLYVRREQELRDRLEAERRRRDG